MTRTYVRRTERGKYGSETLQAALKEIKNGVSLKQTSEKYDRPISRPMLRRHRDGKVGHTTFIMLMNSLSHVKVGPVEGL